jgi:hypothetical protein
MITQRQRFHRLQVEINQQLEGILIAAVTLRQRLVVLNQRLDPAVRSPTSDGRRRRSGGAPATRTTTQVPRTSRTGRSDR